MAAWPYAVDPAVLPLRDAYPHAGLRVKRGDVVVVAASGKLEACQTDLRWSLQDNEREQPPSPLARLLSRIKASRFSASQWWWVSIAIAVLLILSPLGSPKGPGLKGKTWWDWLQLAGIPATLAGFGFWFQSQQRRRDLEERKENRKRDQDEEKEEIMQRYFDRVASLLIDKRLIETADAAIRENRRDPLVESAKDVIRARTLQMIRRLRGDARRQSAIFQFLHETDINSKLMLNLGADLSEEDFSGVNFYRVNLSNANLREANFSAANLRKANLSESNLSKADLSDVNLREANLSWANLSGAVLRGANLSKSDANLLEVNLRCANLSEADLRKANLSKASLSHANLSGTDLRWASLRGADLSRANLSNSNFNGSDLRWASLSEADVRGANLSEANLHWANLSEANLRGANLSKANLSKANLSGVIFGMTEVEGFFVRRSRNQGWPRKFRGLTLPRLYSLSPADLPGANLSGANLSGADLSGADLSDVHLMDVMWDEETKWPGPDRFAGAHNIPVELKKQLGL